MTWGAYLGIELSANFRAQLPPLLCGSTWVPIASRRV
jgi:hypothetical protein